jgi:hypothetical protein
MEMFYTPEKDTVFEALFGRTVVSWNVVEGQVRELLRFFASDQGIVGGLGPSILVAEMGTRHLSETLQAYAYSVFENDAEQAAIHHVTVLFENLVAYRNHYVHGIQHLHENVGCIGTYTAKSKFKIVSGDISIEEMGGFLDKIGELSDYIYEIEDYLVAPADGKPALPNKPEPLPQLTKQTTLLPIRNTNGEPAPE